MRCYCCCFRIRTGVRWRRVVAIAACRVKTTRTRVDGDRSTETGRMEEGIITTTDRGSHRDNTGWILQILDFCKKWYLFPNYPFVHHPLEKVLIFFAIINCTFMVSELNLISQFYNVAFLRIFLNDKTADHSTIASSSHSHKHRANRLKEDQVPYLDGFISNY